ncbi:MAG: hypothetical protein GYB31_08620 [Bacteroidetes bacterium]|nr:hypothetical protein [Bacteroidota bacterium]
MTRLAGIYSLDSANSESFKPDLSRMLDIMNVQAKLPLDFVSNDNFHAGIRAHSDSVASGIASDNQLDISAILDGHFYNRKALQGQLKLSADTSDSQLLIHAFKKWGIACLDYLDGRFSFLLYEPSSGLWVARDRFGVKPMYYTRIKDAWYFASEQKAFLSLPQFDLSLNPESVFDFFFRNKAANTETELFAGLNQLMPAHYMHLPPTREKIEVKRWYRLPFVEKTGKYNKLQLIDYQNEISTLLNDSITDRLSIHKSEKAATFLSGGLDSSLLAAILNESGDVQAFSAVFPRQSISEEDWAAKVKDYLGIDWTRVEPRLEQFRQEWKAFYFSQDVPTYSFGTFNQYSLFAACKEAGVRAVFDGQAADALFAGHNYHLAAFWRELWRNKHFKDLRTELKAFGGSRQAIPYFLRNYLKYVVLPKTGPGLLMWLRQLRQQSVRFFQPAFIDAHQHRLKEDAGDHMFSLNAMLQAEYMDGEVLGLLKCVDRAAAWNGLEVLTPFADDKKLIERVFQIPAQYKIHRNESKHILREIAAKKLPHAVVRRRDKMGLVAPNNAWLQAIKEEMKPYFESLDPTIFNLREIQKHYDHFFNLENPLENFRTYKFMAFTLWLASIKHYTGRAI